MPRTSYALKTFGSSMARGCYRYPRSVSPRVRMTAIVSAVAVAAAGVVVGVTLATRTPTPHAAKPLKGAPPLELDLGLRADAEATALRTAAQLLARGRRREAAAVFARYRSLQAQTGLAFAEWPERSPSRELALADENPASAFA